MDEMTAQCIEGFARQFMSAEPGHDFEHVKRVRNWARIVARGEGYAALDVVEAAALLHDIGLPRAEPRRMHGGIGAKMAGQFLREHGWFPEETVAEICNAIRHHCTNRTGSGKLLDILRDADMMDMFGAMGIIRCVRFASGLPDYAPCDVQGPTWGMTAKDFDHRFDMGIGIGETVTDYLNFHISCYDNLVTQTARRLAAPLAAFISTFVRQLDSEVVANAGGVAPRVNGSNAGS